MACLASLTGGQPRQNPFEKEGPLKELRSEIEIQASAERVWQLGLTDFASFPQWNPFIRKASESIQVGERLEVNIQPSGASGMTFRPTVLKAESNRELRWLGHLLISGSSTVSTASPSNRLVRVACGSPEREVFTGLLVPLFAADWIPTRGAALKK